MRRCVTGCLRAEIKPPVEGASSGLGPNFSAPASLRPCAPPLTPPLSLLFYGNKGPFFNTETRAVGLSLASRDAQTEPVGISESSAQAPEFSLEVAGQAQASLGSSTARRKQAAGAGGRVQLEMSEALQKHLAMFVQGAFPIVDSVLAGARAREKERERRRSAWKSARWAKRAICCLYLAESSNHVLQFL